MSKKVIKPIVKWTGGKYSEFKEFKEHIPSFKNYYEPFFGGGGVFFHLQPDKSFINDKSFDLMNFYNLIPDKDFQDKMLFFGVAWKESNMFFNNIKDDSLISFNKYLNNNIDYDEFKETLNNIIDNETQDINRYRDLFSVDFMYNRNDGIVQIKKSLNSKLKKIKQISINENKTFTNFEMFQHIDVGIKSGVYTQIREIMNKSSLGEIKIPLTYHTCCWYLVREFCFSAMFRYNVNGEFNIPYGGIGYNKKDFHGKIKKLFNDDITLLFQNSTIDYDDFENFLKKHPPTTNDFIFVDPPYDSTFSEYDQNKFTDNDQIRLRDVLFNSKAKWMVIIKETDFIRKIYNEINSNIFEFNKKYMSNMRSRNERNVRHLIIKNYL